MIKNKMITFRSIMLGLSSVLASCGYFIHGKPVYLTSIVMAAVLLCAACFMHPQIRKSKFQKFMIFWFVGVILAFGMGVVVYFDLNVTDRLFVSSFYASVADFIISFLYFVKKDGVMSYRTSNSLFQNSLWDSNNRNDVTMLTQSHDINGHNVGEGSDRLSAWDSYNPANGIPMASPGYDMYGNMYGTSDTNNSSTSAFSDSDYNR